MSRRDSNRVRTPAGWSRDLGGVNTPGIAGRYGSGQEWSLLTIGIITIAAAALLLITLFLL